MFQQLAKIINMMTSQIKEVPTRLEKDRMKEFAQLDDRYQVRSGWENVLGRVLHMGNCDLY